MEIKHVDPEKESIRYSVESDLFLNSQGEKVEEGFAITLLRKGKLAVIPITVCRVGMPIRYSESMDEAYSLLKWLQESKLYMMHLPRSLALLVSELPEDQASTLGLVRLVYDEVKKVAVQNSNKEATL